ncbi:hypothetical protein QAO71_10625 [Halopseudomonas sp. SMJS2]|uniref:hypothetical protein n=1 Tax=Halopseudomonas sp. SMJS2 TaxID=3041098 RepID=UPI0024533AC9|nr:hypothetical protein [Halopseudomonas sp. SMJS2]WGK60547.1 hypothetical protein QAO71_10625 [Halopseudomonas sp. SMJS2]
MFNTITDDVIKEIEAAAALPGSYWYESVDDLVDLFPADDGDAAFVFAATPERVAALIQRMRNAEAKLLSLAVAVTGPDRQRATMMAQSVIQTVSGGKAA